MVKKLTSFTTEEVKNNQRFLFNQVFHDFFRLKYYAFFITRNIYDVKSQNVTIVQLTKTERSHRSQFFYTLGH